ncbi:MAG: hypothetical protein K2I63_03495 [Helicobacter sp.]|nr:hypothetical protein [Helicobacter sp.]
MFFQKTIQLTQNSSFSLSTHVLKLLKNSGIKASIANLQIGEKGIYFSLPNGEVTKVMLYQYQIQESLFHSNGEPVVHLRSCIESKKGIHQGDFLAIIKPDLRFFLSIYSRKIETKIFHDKPLSLCSQCSKILNLYQNDFRLFFQQSMQDYENEFPTKS